jgi:hypothetical protein
MTTYSTCLICDTRTTLQPGVYTLPVVISGAANVTFAPGTYIFQGGIDVIGNAVLSGSGVTFYDANGPMIFAGNGTVTLSPAATGPYAGVTMFQARNDPYTALFIGGMQANLSGAYYFPAAQVQVYGGTNLTFGFIDAQSMTITGGFHQCAGF